MRLICTVLLLFRLSCICAGRTVAAERGQWTFMVYLDGDNDLEAAAIEDFNEMEMVGSTEDVNVIVLFDRIEGFDESNGNWSDSRLFRVVKDNNRVMMTSPVLYSLGEKNMGDHRTLADFIRWSVINYPAEHYALILWGHGDGWRKRALLKGTAQPAFKAVCSDGTDQDCLSSAEVSDALALYAIPVDLLAYDACLMAMIENAYQIRDLVEIMVASEEIMPVDGFPYHTILTDLHTSPHMAPAAVAAVMVKRYGEEYATGEVTLAAISLSEISAIVAKLDYCTDLLIDDNSVWGGIADAWIEAEDYSFRDHKDLGHFAALIEHNVSSAGIKQSACNLKNDIAAAVIANVTSETVFPEYRGLTIYFPFRDRYDKRYGDGNYDIDFPQESHWVQFLQAFYLDCYFELEPNNSYALTGGYVENKPYWGQIGEADDVDVYRIENLSRRQISLRLKPPVDVRLSLCRVEGDEIQTLASSDNEGTNDEVIVVKLPAGIYYATVDPKEASEQIYSLEFSGIDAGEIVTGTRTLAYDDGEAEHHLYFETDRKGIGCVYHSPNHLPATVKGMWFSVSDLDAVPGEGDGGSFLLYARDQLSGINLLKDSVKVVTPMQRGWCYVDLGHENIVVQGSFLVGMYWDGINTPAIGYDDVSTFGNTATYEQMNGVYRWDVIPGDQRTFFIRVELQYGSSAVDSHPSLEMPSSFRVYQNYPNPFTATGESPATVISFDLPRSAAVELSVFNILGQKLATLENRVLPAGRHSVTWDGSTDSGLRAATGIYLYRLQWGAFRATRKMYLY